MDVQKLCDAAAMILQVAAELKDKDLVEVVRCKDCKFKPQDALSGKTAFWNPSCGELRQIDDCFCSLGERRNDAEIR